MSLSLDLRSIAWTDARLRGGSIREMAKHDRPCPAASPRSRWIHRDLEGKDAMEGSRSRRRGEAKP